MKFHNDTSGKLKIICNHYCSGTKTVLLSYKINDPKYVLAKLYISRIFKKPLILNKNYKFKTILHVKL